MIIMYDENGKFYLDGKDKAILQKCVYENPIYLSIHFQSRQR